MRRTPIVDLDKEFTYTGHITKAYVDSRTGERHIVGVATGLEEDKDGERVSKNAIRKMTRKVGDGQVALTASHTQDWWSTIGKAVEASHDPDTDEMSVDALLPGEGQQSLADDAWKVANSGRKIGFSIGGKLLNAYHELTEAGKKRKVLDDIDLRHICLTENPAYESSFAQAVAKTWDGDEPKDDEFTEEVEKDLTTGGWVSDSERTNQGRDSKGSGQRNAGTRDKGTKKPNVQDEGREGEEDDTDLPVPKADRHLSCPNCGHEFAADLPSDLSPEERQEQERTPENKEKDKDDSGAPKEKSGQEAIVDLTKQLNDLQALVAKHIESGAPDPPPEPDPAPPSEPSNVEKMVAASHAEHDERIAKVEATIAEGFGLIGENLATLRDQVGALPRGRRSVARVMPDGLPQPNGHPNDELAKTADDDDGSPAAGLKAINERAFGIR